MSEVIEEITYDSSVRSMAAGKLTTAPLAT